MLSFDPAERIDVIDSLAHPWLSAYHDVTDEPACVVPFDRWQELERLDTIEQFRTALWDEIQDYRREARWVGHVSRGASIGGSPITESRLSRSFTRTEDGTEAVAVTSVEPHDQDHMTSKPHSPDLARQAELPVVPEEEDGSAPVDPLVSYARRSTLIRNSSTFSAHSPVIRGHRSGIYGTESRRESNGADQAPPIDGIPFPSVENESYVFPSRARTMSYASGDATRKLLRTLSTLSIHESGEGLPGGLAGVAPIGKYIHEDRTMEAPPSAMPEEFAVEWPQRQRITSPKPTPQKKKMFHID
jgi:hypothetical protein